MKSILIVGGAGFIGSNLVGKLLDASQDVTVFDNLCTGSMENLSEYVGRTDFEFILGDVSAPLPKFDKEFEQIYHLASPASPPKYIELAIETMLANSTGTKNLLDLAEQTNSRLLFASTSEVYGDPTISPQPENYWGNVNPIGPRSIYDESKRFGEALIAEYQRSQRSNSVIVRLFNTYGPKMDPFDGRVVSNFIRQALKQESFTMYGDGTQTRSFCYVDDTVDALIAAMNSRETGPINIGNPSEINLLELAQKVCEVLEVPLEVTFGDLPTDDPKQRKPDVSLAEQRLGWTPSTPLPEGIRSTAVWMRAKLS